MSALAPGPGSRRALRTWGHIIRGGKNLHPVRLSPQEEGFAASILGRQPEIPVARDAMKTLLLQAGKPPRRNSCGHD